MERRILQNEERDRYLSDEDPEDEIIPITTISSDNHEQTDTDFEATKAAEPLDSNQQKNADEILNHREWGMSTPEIEMELKNKYAQKTKLFQLNKANITRNQTDGRRDESIIKTKSAPAEAIKKTQKNESENGKQNQAGSKLFVRSDNSQKKSKETRCHFCNQKGHIQRYCPQSDVWCTHCETTFHNSDECWSKPKLDKKQSKETKENQKEQRSKRDKRQGRYLENNTPNRNKHEKDRCKQCNTEGHKQEDCSKNQKFCERCKKHNHNSEECHFNRRKKKDTDNNITNNYDNQKNGHTLLLLDLLLQSCQQRR